MKRFRSIKRLTGLILMLMILASTTLACSPSSEAPIPVEEVATVAAETVHVLLPEASQTSQPTKTAVPTSIPPTAILPSATPTPPPASTPVLPDATRITFVTGATYGTATGMIQAGQTQNFVLGAQVGQPMISSLSSQNNDATMSIIAGDGTALLSASQGLSNWQGTLPATQDYYFQVIGGTSTENFSLWVSIPSRIEFAPGAISAAVQGKTAGGNITSYVVAAQAGQTMNILLIPIPSAAALTVWGFSDGQPYIRAVVGSTTFNMKLPSTQDYIIDVVPHAGQEVNFNLAIVIK
jgi:hypothetical protein